MEPSTKSMVKQWWIRVDGELMVRWWWNHWLEDMEGEVMMMMMKVSWKDRLKWDRNQTEMVVRWCWIDWGWDGSKTSEGGTIWTSPKMDLPQKQPFYLNFPWNNPFFWGTPMAYKTSRCWNFWDGEMINPRTKAVRMVAMMAWMKWWGDRLWLESDCCFSDPKDHHVALAFLFFRLQLDHWDLVHSERVPFIYSFCPRSCRQKLWFGENHVVKVSRTKLQFWV